MAGRVTIFLDPHTPSASALRGYFAEVLSSLDAAPRRLIVRIVTENDDSLPVSVRIEKGEPVFSVGEGKPARASFRGRWLAEHPSPMTFNPRGDYLIFIPAGANRLKVRRPSPLCRLYLAIGELFAKCT